MSKLTDFVGDEYLLTPINPDVMEAERFLYEHDVVLCKEDNDPGQWVPEWIIFYYYNQWKIAQNAETGMTSLELRNAIPAGKRFNNVLEGVYYLKMMPGKIVTKGPLQNKQAKLEFVQDVICEERKQKLKKARIKAGKASGLAQKEKRRQHRKEKKERLQNEKRNATLASKKDTSQS